MASFPDGEKPDAWLTCWTTQVTESVFPRNSSRSETSGGVWESPFPFEGLFIYLF